MHEGLLHIHVTGAADRHHFLPGPRPGHGAHHVYGAVLFAQAIHFHAAQEVAGEHDRSIGLDEGASDRLELVLPEYLISTFIPLIPLGNVRISEAPLALKQNDRIARVLLHAAESFLYVLGHHLFHTDLQSIHVVENSLFGSL